ncbi:hydantoinase B/oxoprolinase family protein [Halorubrum ezzemoulense]|jgi:N-methylhydantoinase B|uniref:hydantoinase B/oxoprolinase family protein n=1 Tax=Halorubrum ezzemoulense TaxID=337243 RepID=UPI00232E9EF2|nr:hydantoinase B/oxoprolinase family protein [Halorubrum ezzemoulense]MDB2226230.1 hydantoinase B/oxoprolinase family protein [Halorubrum ezzemoulense]MDB2265144.1 hydantoinase B/oxoprolinase family protein [Halorubrum ezzemoulense]MDB2272473.1 hydantoinase B/oxoprolinase family protein [Halorubrum ezzemoulense]MDB2276483.1 hydantoinase B/oxoprolinase family protein [Halorubrum ezzemoulense]MDB9302668.1 hydantoinase B/oxoprolinase family protein [Halorubrum ezzemoulense]
MTVDDSTAESIDSVTLEVFRNKLESIAEEMGKVLIRSAYSPNIKERQDCSTALFDADGRMVAQAEHIPVHLGAMPDAVAAVTAKDPEPGDAYILNDPFEGGTHLPDVTIVSPIATESDVIGYAVTRAHHADMGGMTPGSMPAGATDIYQEGLRLPAVKLRSGGELNEDLLAMILANVRNRTERRADLRAQLAAHDRAEDRLRSLIDEHGRDQVNQAFGAVINYSQARMTDELTAFPDGTYEAHDVLEGDGVSDAEIPIRVSITVDGATVEVDFTGTADQCAGNMNAPLSVAKSAVYFVVRCITDPEIPPNYGSYADITVTAPQGTVVNPTPPASVVGGNVETSQRLTDVVFAAFAEAAPERVPAASQGTMNNVIIGNRDRGGFTYYETIGGGFGARPDKDGMDGVQVGMTNTLNTPIEVLEAEYPFTVEQYGFREGSGGDGQYRGGLGLVRSVTIETEAVVSLLTERRRRRPQGAAGGEPGAAGENLANGEPLPAKTTREVEAGTTITVRTPGGGGYGNPSKRTADDRKADRLDEKVSDNHEDQ